MADHLIMNTATYSIVAREPNRFECVELKAGDILGYARKSSYGHEHYQAFMIGSVVSFALANGHDPIARVALARERGHALHFIFPLGSVISNQVQTLKTMVAVRHGMRVRFEGRTFEIFAAPERNLDLSEVKDD